jgi:5'(3')-deoxyribonucleotidase
MGLSAVYLDMDGVLVDLMDGIAKMLDVEVAPFYGPLHDSWEAVSVVLKHVTGEEWTEERLMATIAERGLDFWIGLRKYPWADELLALCEGFAPTVLMTSPAHLPVAAAGKMEWIFKNFPHVERYSITSCKHHLSRPDAVLIDDSVEFCEKFREHGGVAYLFPQPWSDPSGWASRDALAEICELLERTSCS